jgi:hypothetical protein
MFDLDMLMMNFRNYNGLKTLKLPPIPMYEYMCQQLCMQHVLQIFEVN